MSNKKNNVATNNEQVMATTNNEQVMATTNKRFTISVDDLMFSTVTDNVTGKAYKCKHVWYTRNGFRRFYIDVTKVENKNMKSMFSFPWQAMITEDGKLKGTNPVGTVIEHDLGGKQAMMITEDMFI